jgi:two-component system, sensor histidine kinase PdtaS
MSSIGSRFRRILPPNTALTHFLVLAVMLPILFFGFAAYRDWRNIESEAVSRIVHVRDALGEHALRVFKTHRVVAYAIGDRVAGMPWEAVTNSPSLHAYLSHMVVDFPEIRAISVLDERGLLRASSSDFPAVAEDFGTEDWFQDLRRGAASVTVERASGAGHWVEGSFTLSFRRGGEVFRGVVRIVVSPAYFQAFYATAYPEDGVIVLVRSDGALLARAPGSEGAAAGRLMPGSAFFSAPAEASTTMFAERSSIDGVMRHYGFSRVADFPVHVGVGLGRQELYRLWRTRIRAYGAYFIPAGIALLLLALYAWRSHRDLENVVEARTQALSAAIAEKDQLLKEVHHRVKNNMQIISSLIRMQERVQNSPEDTIRRVQAMAMVHDLIYTHGQFANVDLADYTKRVCESLRATTGRGIAFDMQLVSATVPLERAMPFALILSEVVTDAARRAAPDRLGCIVIGLSTHGGEIELSVADDGIGESSADDGTKKSTAMEADFGMRLVRSLAVQLDAKIDCDRSNGTHFRMTFPMEAPAQAA